MHTYSCTLGTIIVLHFRFAEQLLPVYLLLRLSSVLPSVGHTVHRSEFLKVEVDDHHLCSNFNVFACAGRCGDVVRGNIRFIRRV